MARKSGTQRETWPDVTPRPGSPTHQLRGIIRQQLEILDSPSVPDEVRRSVVASMLDNLPRGFDLDWLREERPRLRGLIEQQIALSGRREGLRAFRRGGTRDRVKPLSALAKVLVTLIREEPTGGGLVIWATLRRHGVARCPGTVVSVARLPHLRGEFVKWRDGTGTTHTASQTYIVNKLLPRLRGRLGLPLRRRPAPAPQH